MSKESEWKEVRLLCLGMVVLKGNKKGVSYVVLDGEDKETADRMHFSSNKITRGNAGSIYSAESSSNSIRKITFVDMDKNRERRALVQVRSKAAETEHQAYIQQKKAGLDDSAIKEMLRPLLVLYHSTNGLGKSALVARVIHIMQRGL